MPKKNSRRQTLSSLDLETFLDEVSTENIKLTSRRNTMSSDDFLQNKIDKLSLRDNENINPNLIPNNNKSNDVSNDVSKIANIKLTVATSNSNDISESVTTKYHSVPVNRSNEQLVRDFCKLRRGLAAPQSHLILLSIAKELQTNSNYPLFSNQILHPEQYSHKSSTLEGKRAILVSLAPMLTDAEKQRQADGLSCELATQCKSVKIKGRGAGVYEYYDILTNIRVPHQEFEKRYYKFMESTKQFINNRLTLQGVPIIPQTIIEITEKATETVKTSSRRTSSRLAPLQSQLSEMNEFVSSVQVEVTTRSRSRRETLSPKTAKDMLVSCLQDDDDDIATNKVESVPKTRTNRRETLSPKTAKEMLVSCLQDDDDIATNKVESVPKTRTNRRETLSPKTAKDMLVSCLQDDDDDISTKNVESVPKTRTNRRETLSPKTAKDMLVSCLQDDDDVSTGNNQIELMTTVDIIDTNNKNVNTTTTTNNRRRQTLSPSSLREMLFTFEDVPGSGSGSNDVTTSVPLLTTHETTIATTTITTTTTAAAAHSSQTGELNTNANESPEYGFLTTDDNNDEDQMILDQFNNELTALLANDNTTDIDAVTTNSPVETTNTHMMNISSHSYSSNEKQITSPVFTGKRNRVMTPSSNNNKSHSSSIASIHMNESSPVIVKSTITTNFEPSTPTTLPNLVAPKRPSFGRKSLTKDSNTSSLSIVETISETVEQSNEMDEVNKIIENSNLTSTTAISTTASVSTLFSSADNLFTNQIPTINTDAALFFNSAPSSPLNTNKMDIMSKILHSPCPKGEAINVYMPNSIKTMTLSHSKNVHINESVFSENNQQNIIQIEMDHNNQVNNDKKELFTISSTFSRMNSHNNILTIDDVPMVNLISESRYSPVKSPINATRSHTPPVDDNEELYNDFAQVESFHHNNIDRELTSAVSTITTTTTVNMVSDSGGDTDMTADVVNSTDMETKAMARLYARFDVAKWKFNYEMTLVQLIMEANLSRC